MPIKKLAILLLLVSPMAWAEPSTGTVTTTGTVYCEKSLPVGIGYIKLVGDFDGGTLVVYTKRANEDSWDVSKSYTEAPDPNPQRMDFTMQTRVKIEATSVNASTSVYCEIDGPNVR